MRVQSVLPVRLSNSIRKNENHLNYVQQQTYNDFAYTSGVIPNFMRVSDAGGFSVITFTGNTDKNINQVASLCFENKGTGLAEDFQGGLGVVTYEAPNSFNKHEGMDVRSFSPFHEYSNGKGGYRFLITKDIEKVDGKLPDEIPAKYFVSAAPGQSKEELAKALKIEPEDLRFVIQGEPNAVGPEGKSKYNLIEPTSVKGEFERMSDTDIGELQKVRYEIFKYAEDNPPYVKLAKEGKNYWVYTQELAKTTKPYTYGPEGSGGMTAEIINSDYCRAVKESIPKMNTEEFGFYNPASFWGHDRPAMWFASFVADASAKGDENWSGTITHNTMHNPRRPYQGITYNPFEFARAIFSKEDVESLKNHPDYKMLQNFSEKGWDNLTQAEKEFVNKAFEPYIGKFKDFFGAYNITKIGIVAKMINPKNSSIGTVSPAFEEQMRDPNMDVAPGLGDDLRKVKMVSPLNGSTPANLGIDNNTGNFGRGNNTLSARKADFTPLIYNGNNIEELIQNREKNAVWLTDILRNAEKEGPDSVNKVFFNDLQISQGRHVIGSISDYKKGDMLVIGWGRPDPQKGFPISVKGAYEFFANPKVPQEYKDKMFFQFGWGDLPFNKEDRDWKLIDEYYNKLINLDGGKYKNHMQLVNGRYPNKLVACATHGLFTSRDEICGITPFESMTAGVPYGTTAAGGPKGYTDSSIGWKTKTAPEMNPEFDKLTWDTPADVLDDARVNRSSKEVSDMLFEMAEEYHKDKKSYIQKCKNCIERQFDWHNNGALNGNISANKMYKNKIWHIEEGFKARNKNPMKRLVGKIKELPKPTFTGGEKQILNDLENITALLKKLLSKANKGNKNIELTKQEIKNLGNIIKILNEITQKDSKIQANAVKKLTKLFRRFSNSQKDMIENINSLKEEFHKLINTASEKSGVTSAIKSNKWTKIAFASVASAFIAGSAVYVSMKKADKKLTKTA